MRTEEEMVMENQGLGDIKHYYMLFGPRRSNFSSPEMIWGRVIKDWPSSRWPYVNAIRWCGI